MKLKVTYSDIYTRNQRINYSVQEDKNYLLDEAKRLLNMIKENNDTQQIVRFMRFCNDSPDLSTIYFSECLDFATQNPNHKLIRSMMNRITEITDTTVVEKYKLPEYLNNTFKKNKVIDRILENNKRICKKENLDEFFFENYHLDSTVLVNKCCSIVDQFDMKPYAKVNTSIEECVYLFGKNDIIYNEAKMVSDILKYYMVENCTAEDIQNIDKVIDTNYCIDIDDEEVCKELNKLVNSFLSCYVKEPCNITTLIQSVLQIDLCYIKDAFSKLVSIFRICYIKNNNFSNNLDIAIPNIYNQLNDLFGNKNNVYYRDILLILIEILIEETEDISNIYINRFNNETSNQSIIRYKSILKDLLEKLELQADILYDSYNMKCIHANYTTESEIISLEEFKLFKFNNLISTCKKIEDKIKSKVAKLKKKSKDKIKQVKFKSELDEEIKDNINNIKEMVYENGVDFTVAFFEINTTQQLNIQELLSEICRDINESNIVNSNQIVYYLIHPQYAEIKLNENIIISDYNNIISESSSELLDDRYNILEDTSIYYNIVKETEQVSSDQTPDPEMVDLYNQCCSILGIQEDVVKDIWKEYYYTNHMGLAYQPLDLKEEVSFDIVIETYSIMQSILEDMKENKFDKKKDKAKHSSDKVDKLKNSHNKEGDSRETGEKEFGKMRGINNVKLYLNGLKKKAKDLSAKEKELSRNADTSFNMLIKNIKNAMVSDRRESIIKGSVIPSFSKSCKIAVALAGVAAINPGVAIIGALGGLAASKRLTKKERALLLDEIDVELEMIEKEIQLAESRNQMKKLRKLMLIKKDLQREYQRIKLNIRIGKDIMPGNTVGRKQYD